MTALCPACLGEGSLDFTISDARIGEECSDADLARLRAAGFQHPLGVLVCEECSGSGLVTEERARDLAAAARAMADQALARFRDEGLLGEPRAG